MRHLKIIALALCIFISGILAGAFGMRIYVQRAARDVLSGNPAFAERLVLSRLDAALDLTADQEARLRPLVAAGAEKFASLRLKFVPEVDAILEATAHDMKPELTPEQGARLDALLNNFKALRRPQAQ